MGCVKIGLPGDDPRLLGPDDVFGWCSFPQGRMVCAKNVPRATMQHAVLQARIMWHGRRKSLVVMRTLGRILNLGEGRRRGKPGRLSAEAVARRVAQKGSRWRGTSRRSLSRFCRFRSTLQAGLQRSTFSFPLSPSSALSTSCSHTVHLRRTQNVLLQ